MKAMMKRIKILIICAVATIFLKWLFSRQAVWLIFRWVRALGLCATGLHDSFDAAWNGCVHYYYITVWSIVVITVVLVGLWVGRLLLAKR
jgi:hypothetical protein